MPPSYPLPHGVGNSRAALDRAIPRPPSTVRAGVSGKGAFSDEVSRLWRKHRKADGGRVVRDAVALYDMVQKRHSKIVVVGRSLGSGVAAYLASLRTVERLVLVTPFDSVEAVAAEQFRFFPVRWLLRDRYESSKYVQSVSAPTLIVVAARDEVIPLARTQALYAQFRPGVASMRVVEGV